MIDTGNSVDILFKDALDRFNLKHLCYYSCTTPFYGFTRDSIFPIGMISLPIILEESPRQVNTILEFLVVDTPNMYIILGRPFL